MASPWRLRPSRKPCRTKANPRVSGVRAFQVTSRIPCNVWSGNKSGGASMAGTTDGVLLTAADATLKVAEAEAAKAEEHARAKAAAEAEKNALIQELQKPPSLSPDEKLKHAAAIIDRAIKNGQR